MDGVYFDCCCGAAEGLTPHNMPGFMQAAQDGFDAHLPVTSRQLFLACRVSTAGPRRRQKDGRALAVRCAGRVPTSC